MTEGTQPLLHLLGLMALSSERLISQWEAGAPPPQHAGSIDEADHRQMIAQVIAHRADEAAKGWVTRNARHIATRHTLRALGVRPSLALQGGGR